MAAFGRGCLSVSVLASESDVRRVDLGFFVRPATETGTGAARVEPALSYLVTHP
jgi:N-acyl homoserine lactone hydrolase